MWQKVQPQLRVGRAQAVVTASRVWHIFERLQLGHPDSQIVEYHANAPALLLVCVVYVVSSSPPPLSLASMCAPLCCCPTAICRRPLCMTGIPSHHHVQPRTVGGESYHCLFMMVAPPHCCSYFVDCMHDGACHHMLHSLCVFPLPFDNCFYLLMFFTTWPDSCVLFSCSCCLLYPPLLSRFHIH